MGLFSEEKDYNEELKNAVAEWINASGGFKKGSVVNKIKKYADKKLKNETGFSNKQFRLLKDVTSRLRGVKIMNYDTGTLRLMHLQPDEFEMEYKQKVIEKLTTTGIAVTFLKIDKKLTNNAVRDAVAGGLTLGIGGALIGGAHGASNQKITEHTVPGEMGNLKVADKGIVIRSNSETARIEWDKIREMRGNLIELIDGKHIIFYSVPDTSIVEMVINNNIPIIDDKGW